MLGEERGITYKWLCALLTPLAFSFITRNAYVNDVAPGRGPGDLRSGGLWGPFQSHQE